MAVKTSVVVVPLGLVVVFLLTEVITSGVVVAIVVGAEVVDSVVTMVDGVLVLPSDTVVVPAVGVGDGLPVLTGVVVASVVVALVVGRVVVVVGDVLPVTGAVGVDL